MAKSRRAKRERLSQKLRTRQALLAAARKLLAAGHAPSVAEVADEALVSRATAYRYFPTRDELLVEAPLDVAAPTVASLFGENGPADPEDRVALVQNALYDLARDHEAQFRVFLRGSLTRSVEAGGDAGEPLRGARRAALLTAALAPLSAELTPREIERLKAALAVLVGVESMIVLRDVLRVSHEDARKLGEWAVRRLVRAARQPGPGRGVRQRSSRRARGVESRKR